jgi:methyl-accepting chemotaxis protein
MKEISTGKLELKIHYQDRNDEVGEMAKALEVFRYNAEEKIKLEKEQDQIIKVSQKEKEESKIALTKEFENNVQNIILKKSVERLIQ